MIFSTKTKLAFPLLILMTVLFIQQSQKVYAEDFPESFRLSDHDIATEVYTQGDYNTCWAITATDAINLQLKKIQEKRNFSPWYLAYSAYTGANKFPENIDPDNPFSLFYKGGSNYISSAVLTSGNGMAYDSDIKYGAHPNAIENFNIRSSVESGGKIKNDYVIRNIFNITPWISQKKKFETDYIKKFLFDKNAVCVTCSLSDEYFNPETSALFYNDDNYNCHTDTNYHSVLLVGWDDNFSRTNFKKDCIPSKDGAWLAKNSWGEEWGNEGYMWISYEDTSMCEAVVYSDISENIYDSDYQYDEYGWTTSVSPSMVLNIRNIKDENGDDFYPSTTGYMANIFKADDDEYIYDISFYTIEENCEYELFVYTDLEDHSVPTSGAVLSQQKGTILYPGYHTVELDEKPHIKKGDYFSIVAKIKNPSSVHTVPIDACILLSADYIENQSGKYIGNINSIIFKSKKNESFVSCNGKDWADLMLSKNGIQKNIIINERSYFPGLSDDETPVQFYMGNVCMKALTVKYTPYYGDINDDGVVTAVDLALAVNHMLGKKSIPNERFADLNNDSEVNISDLILLKNYINDIS